MPPDLLQALRKPLLDLDKYFQGVRYRKEHPGPEYMCPACSIELKRRPVKVFDRGVLEQVFGSARARVDTDAGRGSNGVLFVDCLLY